MRQTKRIDTKDVQGEGSYVVLRPITWAEQKGIRSALDSGGLDNIQETERILSQYLLEWNWTGDDDAALPAPNTPGVFDKLTMEEVGYLVDALIVNSQYRKN